MQNLKQWATIALCVGLAGCGTMRGAARAGGAPVTMSAAPILSIVAACKSYYDVVGQWPGTLDGLEAFAEGQQLPVDLFVLLPVAV